MTAVETAHSALQSMKVRALCGIYENYPDKYCPPEVVKERLKNRPPKPDSGTETITKHIPEYDVTLTYRSGETELVTCNSISETRTGYRLRSGDATPTTLGANVLVTFDDTRFVTADLLGNPPEKEEVGSSMMEVTIDTEYEWSPFGEWRKNSTVLDYRYL